MEEEGNSEVMVMGDISSDEFQNEDKKTIEDQVEDHLSEAEDQSEEEDSELNDTDMERNNGSDEDNELEVDEEKDTDNSMFDMSMVIACRYCSGKEFDNYSELCIHATEEHPLVCLYCFQSFGSRSALNKHQSKTNHTVWRCNICNEIFLKQSDYEKHVTNKHYECCPYKCTVCRKYGTFKEDNLNSHYQSCRVYLKRRSLCAYGSKLCGRCYRTFGSYYSLVLHICKEHAEVRHKHIYKCESCKIGFEEVSHFKSHVNIFHPDDEKYLSNVDDLIQAINKRSRTCVKCDLLLSSSFSRHLKSYHPEAFIHKCDQCESSFSEETDLEDHRVKNHGGNPFVCQHCNKTCRGVHRLRKHLNVAHGLPMCRFFCFMHNKGFEKFKNLKEHIRRDHQHIEDVALIERRKRRKELWQKSKLASRNGKPFTCDTCGRAFANKGSWECHVIKHTEKFKCDICFAKFESQSNLSRHMVVHTGEKPYQCELCGLRVSQKSSLARHRKVVHSKSNLNLKRTRLVKQRRTRGPAHRNLKSEDEFQDVDASMGSVSTAGIYGKNVNGK